MLCTGCGRLYHDFGAPMTARGPAGLCRACAEREIGAVLPPAHARGSEENSWIDDSAISAKQGRGANVSGAAWVAACALVIALGMGAVAKRASLVAWAPGLGLAFDAVGLKTNDRGLDIEDVRARLGTIGDKKVLMVEGSVVNRLAKENDSPELSISLRDADGRELYVWTTHGPKGHLAKTSSARFAARLEAPPEGVKEALVRFVSTKTSASRVAEGS